MFEEITQSDVYEMVSWAQMRGEIELDDAVELMNELGQQLVADQLGVGFNLRFKSLCSHKIRVSS